MARALNMLIRPPHSALAHSTHRRLGLLVLAACVLAGPGPSFAEPSPEPHGPNPPVFPTREISAEDAKREIKRLTDAAHSAFNTSDYVKAEALLRELIPLDQSNVVPWYNLACALSLQGKTDEAVQMLQQAIARGYANRRQIETDKDLARARTSPAYAALMASFGELQNRRLDQRLAAAKRTFNVDAPGSPYRLIRDDELRLVYISAFDAKLTSMAQADARKLAGWWRTYVQIEPAAEDKAGRRAAPDSKKSADLGEKDASTEHPHVFVILPTREDFQAWARKRFGDLADRVGGEYDHDNKTLSSMDLGATWRHEFWHVMHWRHMDQLGQQHPIWIMEGLCSLPEDVETGGNGEMIVRPSWRTNMARNLARGGALTGWSVLFSMDRNRFISSRPLAFYAQSRAIFMYLFHRGKLGAWYAAYVQNFSADPTGKMAMERVFEQPLAQIERDYRLWLRDLPVAESELGRQAANLPFEVLPGAGDGPTVLIDLLGSLDRRSPQQDTAGLKNGDVLTALNETQIRDSYELAHALADLEPGTTVTVSYRRGNKHGTASIKLVPPR